MKNVTKKLLVLIAGVLLIAMVLSSCAIDSSEGNDVSDEARQEFIQEMIYAEGAELLYTPMLEDYKEVPEGYKKGVSTADGRYNGLTGMSLILKSKNYELYIDFATTDIAVLDLTTKQAYHSNPDRDPQTNLTDAFKKIYGSPLSLVSYDAAGKEYSFNFYADCWDDGEGDFYVVKTGENSIRLIYTIGNDPDKDLFPPVVTKDTYENVILANLDECYNNGTIDLDKWESYNKLLGRAYRFVDPKAQKGDSAYLSIDEAERFKENFPTIDIMSLYIAREGVTSKQKKQIKELMETIGFTAQDVKKEMDRAEYQGPQRSILYTIPVDLTLDGDGLEVSIDSSLVLGPTKQRLYTINMYPGFGATKGQDGAYMIVPDGSGAVIPLNGARTAGAYKARLYGEDGSFAKEIDATNSEQVLAPYVIYDRGVNVKTSHLNAGSVVAVLEDGAGQASVLARPVSGTNPPVATISYEVIYSERDYRTYSTSSESSDVGGEQGSGTLLSKDPVTGIFRVQYLFTESGKTYSEYAAYLREYFTEKGLFPEEKLNESELPLYVDLIGCVDLNQTVLGVPVKTPTALTSYNQALEILTKLKEAGVDNVVARYNYWANGGENNVAANDLELLDCMGTAGELDSLVQYCNDNGMGFFPSVEFLHVTSSGNGFSKSQDAARRMSRSTATIVERMNAIGSLRTDLEEKILVSSKVSAEMAESYKASFEEVIDTKSIALGNLGAEIHSNYKVNDGVTRAWAEKDHVKVLQAFEGYEIAVSTGNFYTWKYADHIFGLPTGATEYGMEESSIPFTQIMLHGYVNYSMDPLNESGDYTTALLVALETGSAFSVRWMGADDSIFDYTSYYNYFSLNYSSTFDRVVKIYQQAAEVLNDVVNEPITNHEKLDAYYTLDHEGLIGWLQPGDEGYVEGENTPAVARIACDGVFATTYGDKKVVVVNYNASDVELNDRTVIQAKGFATFTLDQFEEIINGSAFEPLPEPPAADTPADDTVQEG